MIMHQSLPSPNFSIDENNIYAGTVTATDQIIIQLPTQLLDQKFLLASHQETYLSIQLRTMKLNQPILQAQQPLMEFTPDVQNITVNVNNTNDNVPEWTSGFYFAADENQTAIGTMSATDPDGDSITYNYWIRNFYWPLIQVS